MSINRNASICSYQFSFGASYPSHQRVIGRLGIVLVACAIVACSQNDKTPTTADRVTLVEEIQKNDPNFHLPKATKVPSGDKSNQVAAASSPEAERIADASKSDGTAAVRVR